MDCVDGPGRVAGLLELPCADAPALIDSIHLPRLADAVRSGSPEPYPAVPGAAAAVELLPIDAVHAPREALPEVDAVGVAGALVPNQFRVERCMLRKADVKEFLGASDPPADAAGREPPAQDGRDSEGGCCERLSDEVVDGAAPATAALLFAGLLVTLRSMPLLLPCIVCSPLFLCRFPSIGRLRAPAERSPCEVP